MPDSSRNRKLNVVSESKTIEVRKETEEFDQEQHEEVTANFSPVRDSEDFKDQSIEININNFDATATKHSGPKQRQVDNLVHKLEQSRNSINSNSQSSTDKKHSYKRL